MNFMATAGAFEYQEGLHYPLDLQLFAEEGDEGDNDDENTVEEEVEWIELTKEEFEAEKQKEADRRVSQALKKKEAEFAEQLKKRTAEARKEAEELAKLSAEERAKVEKEREELEIQKERESLQKERAEFERERLKLQAEKELATRGLPPDFAPYIFGDNAEDTMERITVFEEQWQAALEAGIQERLKSKSPKLGDTSKKPQFTREQVENMTREELVANMEAVDESMKNW